MIVKQNVISMLAIGACSIAICSTAIAAPNGAPSKRTNKPDAPDVDKHDPDNVRGLSLFMEKVNAANNKFVSHDFVGAIDLYRQAIQLAPKNPLGHYALAEAELATGNVTEAQASAEQAETASDDRNANLRGKILFLNAAIKERFSLADHPNKWVDAKTAWQAYADFCAKHPDAGVSPQSAAARIVAIDTMMRQDKAYGVVRERISIEKAQLAPAKK
jgi:tetratricopeptide (TPR) repeat protein